jgi:hypothetical protein
MKPILDGFDLIEMVRHFYHPPDLSGFALIMAAMKAFDEADPNARRRTALAHRITHVRKSAKSE